MKKTIFLFSLVVSLTSCSNDDDSLSFSEVDLIGKWYYIEYEYSNGELIPYTLHEEGCEKDYLEFLADETYKQISHDKSCEESIFAEGTWTLEKNQLTFTSEVVSSTFTIHILNETELEFESNEPIIGEDYTITVKLSSE